MPADSYRLTRPAGAVIFREGDRTGVAYIIQKGWVEVSVERDGRRVVLSTLGAGEILGEMAVIDEYARTATATVKEDCELVVVTPQQIRRRLSRADPVIRSLMNILLNRYRSELALERGAPPDVEPDGPAQWQGIRKINMESHLRNAIENEQVQVLYQPIRSLGRAIRNGFEALVRWDAVPYGVVPPEALVKLAEETDLIDLLSLYVFRVAAEDLADFRAAAPGELFVSVNVSPAQAVDSDFLNHAWDLCNEAGCETGGIMLELTESVSIELEKLRDWADIAKAMGFRVSIDDFGTGYTSLEYLTRLEPDTIKIDREFVRLIVDDPRHVTVMRKIIEMARELDTLVIAEGAETYEHLRVLTELDCDMAQGFEIDRPLTKFQTLDLLTR